jgi:hypothetical protein
MAHLGSLGRGGAERAYAGARRAARGGNYARSAYTTCSEPVPDLSTVDRINVRRVAEVNKRDL